MSKDAKEPDFRETGNDSINSKYDIINAAANKSMRWWFFVLLMIGMVVVGFLYTDMRTERTAMRQEIREVRESQLKYVTDQGSAVVTALANNTLALKANTDTLQRLDNRKNP